MTFASFLADPWIAVVALLVTIVGAGRLTRLVTYDDYPPTVAIRSWWNRVTKGNGWAKLAYCLWCFSPWAVALCVGHLALGFVTAEWVVVSWWVLWGWLAVSYLTAILVRHDEPDE